MAGGGGGTSSRFKDSRPAKVSGGGGLGGVLFGSTVWVRTAERVHLCTCLQCWSGGGGLQGGGLNIGKVWASKKRAEGLAAKHHTGRLGLAQAQVQDGIWQHRNDLQA